MKKITLAVLVSFLTVSGLALASQGEEQKERPSMMQEMMKSGKDREHMGGMMQMMKMMEQCSAMMESAHDHGEKTKESQKN
jgi:cytochrome c556